MQDSDRQAAVNVFVNQDGRNKKAPFGNMKKWVRALSLSAAIGALFMTAAPAARADIAVPVVIGGTWTTVSGSSIGQISPIVVGGQSNVNVIQGDGNLSQTSSPLNLAFTSVQANSSVTVRVTYGTSNVASISADSNILPYVSASVNSQGVLSVGLAPGNSYVLKNPVTVEVQTTNLNALTALNAASVNAQGFFGNPAGTVTIDAETAGKINLDLQQQQINNLTLKANASGSFNVADIGNVNQISANLSATGNGKISGNGPNASANITVTTAASFDSTGLPINSATVNASTTAQALVNARNVNATASLLGRIGYIGTPASLQQSTSLGGTIYQIR